MKKSLYTPSAKERRFIFAAPTASKSFYPRPPVLSWRKSLEAAVGKREKRDGK
jgi:hypothetical protein